MNRNRINFACDPQVKKNKLPTSKVGTIGKKSPNISFETTKPRVKRDNLSGDLVYCTQ